MLARLCVVVWYCITMKLLGCSWNSCTPTGTCCFHLFLFPFGSRLHDSLHQEACWSYNYSSTVSMACIRHLARVTVIKAFFYRVPGHWIRRYAIVLYMDELVEVLQGWEPPGDVIHGWRRRFHIETGFAADEWLLQQGYVTFLCRGEVMDAPWRRLYPISPSLM